MGMLKNNFNKAASATLSFVLAFSLLPSNALALEAANIESFIVPQENNSGEKTDLIVIHDGSKDIKQIAEEENLDTVNGGSEIFDEGDNQKISTITIEGCSTEEAIDKISKSESVVKAVEDTEIQATSIITNDQYSTDDGAYYLTNERIKDAWGIQKTKGSVTVAVIDTGVSTDPNWIYDDLSGDVIDYENAWDCVYENDNQNNKPLEKNFIDYHGHGTLVSSLIAARVNNAYGIAGTSYEAKVLPIRVLDSTGHGYMSSIITAYGYILNNADDLNIKVVNMSLGQSLRTEAVDIIEEIVGQAKKEKGILSIASAGNDATDSYCYPASVDNVVSVGAVDVDRWHCYFSQRNDRVDLAAAGDNLWVPQTSVKTEKDGQVVYESNPRNTYSRDSGTSLSAPVVSGVAALMFANNPYITPDEVETILKETATDLGDPGRDNSYGYGEINAYAAISKAQEMRDSRTYVQYNYDEFGDKNVEHYDKDAVIDLPSGEPRDEELSEIKKTGTINYFVDGDLYKSEAVDYKYLRDIYYKFKGWYEKSSDGYNYVGLPGTTYSVGNGLVCQLYGQYDKITTDTKNQFNSVTLPWAYKDHYKFNGWYLDSLDGQFVGSGGEWTPSPSDNDTLNLVASFTPNNYTVQFKDYDGSTLSSQEYQYGTGSNSINIPDNPTREADAQYSYSFSKWDKEITDVTGNATYTAVYSSSIKDKYKVTLKDWDGSVLSEQMVSYGSSASVFTPERDGYKFIGWEGNYNNITKDTVLTAMYKSVEHEFIVTVNNSTPYVYTGSKITPKIIAKFDGVIVNPSSIVGYNNINVGDAKAKVTYSHLGVNYERTVSFKITKATNSSLSVSTTNISVPYGSKYLSKNSIKVSNSKGKLKFSKVSGNKKFVVKDNGKIVIKGTPKVGTYKLTIKVTDNGGNNYKETSKTKEIKITVNKANNPMTVKVKKVKLKRVNSDRAISMSKALVVKKNKGKVTYSKISKGSSKYISIKNNKILIKKSAKGSLKLNVKIKAKGSANYKSKTVNKKITIRIA